MSGFLDEQRVREHIAAVKPAVVLVECETVRGTLWGTGFFISSDGLLVTGHDLVKDSRKVTTIFRNQKRLPTELLKADAISGLALLKATAAEPVPTVTLGDADDVTEGMLVAVTGYPEVGTLVWMGMSLDSTTSRGAVNGTRISSDPVAGLVDRSIQIDVPLAPGNGGGPVFRLDTGEVIGVVSRIFRGAQNDTFAVSSNPARTLAGDVNREIKPGVAPAGSPAVVPGPLNALNTVSDRGELPPLFGRAFGWQSSYQPTAKQLRAREDWKQSTARSAPVLTAVFGHGDDLFFGTTDGKLIRWDTRERGADAFQTLVHTEDLIFLYPPAADGDLVCAVAGALDLAQSTREELNKLGLLAIALGGRGPIKKKRTVVDIEGVGGVYGLSRDNGTILWAVDTGFPSAPRLHAGRVYHGGMGERVCLDAQNGSEVWRVERKDHASADWCHLGHAGDAGVFGVVVPVKAKRRSDQSLTLFGDDKARVESYEPESGKLRWKVEIGDVKESPQPLSTALVVDEASHTLYALAGQVLAAVDASTGKSKWLYDRSKEKDYQRRRKKGLPTVSAVFSGSMTVHGGVVFVGTVDGSLLAFNGETSEILWTYETRGEVGAPAYADGFIYVGSGDGYLHVVEAATGKPAWRVLIHQVRTAPHVLNGMVYAGTEQGQIHTVRIPTEAAGGGA